MILLIIILKPVDVALIVGLSVPISLILICLVILVIFLVFIRKICKDNTKQKPALSKNYLNYVLHRPVTPIEIIEMQTQEPEPEPQPSPIQPPMPPAFVPKPFCDLYPHQIVTNKNAKNSNIYFVFSNMDLIESKINDLLVNEIIFEADQTNIAECKQWLSNPVVTDDGNFFIDIRNLNEITLKTVYSRYVDLKQIIEQLKTASVFSVYDLSSVHSQIKLDERTRYKATFQSPTTNKVYFFNTMP